MIQDIGVIVVAAGSGSRMGGEIPKQYLELCGKPIIVRTIERVLELFNPASMVVVISADQEYRWLEIAKKYNLTDRCVVCFGGVTRFDSVYNAISKIGDDCKIIAIHDGVRPFFTKSMVDELISECSISGAAIPVVEVVDSFRCITNNGSKVVNRSSLRAVQTPQLFRSNLLREAYASASNSSFTDDASLVEGLGVKISLCHGDRENIKITTPIDIAIAEHIIKR